MTQCESCFECPSSCIRVTLDLPSGSVSRLSELAKAGDAVLRELGILSLQVEGDEVISLILSEDPSAESRSETQGSSSGSRGATTTTTTTNGILSVASNTSRAARQASPTESGGEPQARCPQGPSSESPRTPMAPPVGVPSSGRSQMVLNPNTGLLEPVPCGGESSSEGESSPSSHGGVPPPPSSERALKLKLKLPFITAHADDKVVNMEAPTMTTSSSLGGGPVAPSLKRSASSEALGGADRKIPKLILSMKDKTVKMAEKGAVSAGGKLGEEEKKSNNTPLPSRLYPSPYLSHPTKEDPGAPEEKPPRKTKKSGKITALKHNNERVASWTKGLNVGLLNEPINDPDGWKEVLDSRVKPMTPHDDLDMDYSSSSSHIPRYSEPPKSMASNGYDKSSSSSASSIELIKSEPPAFPKHHQELDALTRGEDHGGTLGEDSGIESMDALSEKSPNQGEGEDILSSSSGRPQTHTASPEHNAAAAATSSTAIIQPQQQHPISEAPNETPKSAEQSINILTTATTSHNKPVNCIISSSSSSSCVGGGVGVNTIITSSSSSSLSTFSTAEVMGTSNNPIRMLTAAAACEGKDPKLIATSIKPAGLTSSVPIGAKMVPVKLVTVSGEGNLRLVRVSPVKASENPPPSSARTVVIKSSMLKPGSHTSFFNPSLISKISSSSSSSSITLTSSSTPSNSESQVPPAPVVSSSSSTVCLLPLKTKESESLPSSSSATATTVVGRLLEEQGGKTRENGLSIISTPATAIGKEDSLSEQKKKKNIVFEEGDKRKRGPAAANPVVVSRVRNELIHSEKKNNNNSPLPPSSAVVVPSSSSSSNESTALKDL